MYYSKLRHVADASFGTIRDRAARVATLVGVAVLAIVAPLSVVHAQDAPPPPSGATLVGTVFDSTASAPLRGAAVYLVGTPHLTMTDASGTFALPGLEGGEYTISVHHARLDSIGVSIAPAWHVDVPATGITRISLAIPSMSTLMPGLCIFGDAEHRGIAVGMVRDEATGTPLPHASVEFHTDGDSTIVVESDREGRYVACGLPSGEPMIVQATFFRRAPATELLIFTNDQPVFQTFELELFPGVPVTGHVVDQSTGEAVSGAVVTIESSGGRQGETLTDEKGRFSFERLDLDTYLVAVEHLAYGTQMKWFTIADVTPMELELRLVPDAIELEALVVNVRSRAIDRTVSTGVRRDYVSRVEIEKLLGAVRNVGDLLRTMPGVRVQNLRNQVTGQMELCIEGRRTAQSGCQSVLVVIDGIISDTAYLESLPPNIIESIEFVPSIIAGIRYGRRTGSGVLVITTMR